MIQPAIIPQPFDKYVHGARWVDPSRSRTLPEAREGGRAAEYDRMLTKKERERDVPTGVAVCIQYTPVHLRVCLPITHHGKAASPWLTLHDIDLALN